MEYTPDTPQFENTLLVSGEAVDASKHYNKYAVTLDYIRGDNYGNAVSTGYCICKVDIRNTEHTQAEIVNGATHLQSTVNGTSSIIWKETASIGVQYCVINLNDNVNNGVIISNTFGSTIPANGLMKATLKSGENNWYEVTQPDTANQTNILILDDLDMQAGQTKRLTDRQQYKFLIDTTPAAGDNAGAQAGSFTAKKGNTGLKCYGGSGGTAEGRFFSPTTSTGVVEIDLSGTPRSIYDQSGLSRPTEGNPDTYYGSTQSLTDTFTVSSRFAMNTGVDVNHINSIVGMQACKNFIEIYNSNALSNNTATQYRAAMEVSVISSGGQFRWYFKPFVEFLNSDSAILAYSDRTDKDRLASNLSSATTFDLYLETFPLTVGTDYIISYTI
jgi:hypothetical protein